eukprot:Opistho-2@61508
MHSKMHLVCRPGGAVIVVLVVRDTMALANIIELLFSLPRYCVCIIFKKLLLHCHPSQFVRQSLPSCSLVCFSVVRACCFCVQYPRAILDIPYDCNFAIRGLHYDIRKGFLMKVDAFQTIQLGTVYRGHHPVSNEDTLRLYNGAHIPMDYMNKHMVQLTDLFSLPEACLLANLTQFFIDKQMRVDPEYLYWDVKSAIQELHASRTMHNAVMRDIERYLRKKSSIGRLLSVLRVAGKKVFLLSNSSFDFIDKGMTYMVGSGWRDLFDVILLDAHKPRFYNSERPFRRFDTRSHTKTWDMVTGFESGSVYMEGNLADFTRITGWKGAQTLYCGDHVYSDLVDPSLKQGWRTGAIIHELEREIDTLNSAFHHHNLVWLLNIQRFIKRLLAQEDPAREQKLVEWIAERQRVSLSLKTIFNEQFGSVFRTHHNPTFFAHRMARFADLYTSNVENLLLYPPHHTFYPQRVFMPHEPVPRRDEMGTFRCGP